MNARELLDAVRRGEGATFTVAEINAALTETGDLAPRKLIAKQDDAPHQFNRPEWVMVRLEELQA